MLNRRLPFAVLVLAACSPPTPGTDGGIDAGAGDGGFFADFSAPSTTSVSNAVLITITGEGSATEGTGFPDADRFFANWLRHNGSRS